MQSVPGARWQSDEQLHLTLRFIGEADGRQCDDIAAALARLCAPKLSLGVDGIGAFARRERPHSLWAAVHPTTEVTQLAKSVNRILAGVGVGPDTRAFRPHITLARLGRSAMPADIWMSANAALRIDPASFDHVLLYESVLGGEGASYTIVERYPLG